MSRIIAGSLASRRFATPKGARTRPTTDRVRESVFSFIVSFLGVGDRSAEHQLSGLSFLDLYAGSGAMGLEASSRGAQATWVDSATSKLIRSNCLALGLVPRVVSQDVQRYLAQHGTPYDLVWMDPPYEVSTQDVEQILRLIANNSWLESHAMILVERSRHSSAVEFPESFLKVSPRYYGDTVIYLAEMGP